MKSRKSEELPPVPGFGSDDLLVGVSAFAREDAVGSLITANQAFVSEPPKPDLGEEFRTQESHPSAVCI